MSPSFQTLFFNITALILFGIAVFAFMRPELYARAPIEPVAMSSQAAGAGAASSSPITVASTTPVATSTPPKKTPAKKAPVSAPSPSIAVSLSAPPPDKNQALRIQNPYTFSPLEFPAVNELVRSTLVNILCISKGESLRSVTGSGVIIDPRGVILTNAHVAQYILLSKIEGAALSCIIRTGSPAVSRWRAEILYIPPVWVDAHAADITSRHALGTGEHDYALLRIVDSLDGSPLSISLPFLPIDTRDAIGFEADHVLAASYPAELSAGSAQDSFYAASTVTTIKQLLTFDINSVDLVALGGIIEAQSGSSGGAVVNAWGRLISIIVTTSEGKTTGDRNLHALTLSYINRDFTKQTGHTLSDLLSGDIASVAENFNTNIAPNLIAIYLQQLSSNH